MYRSGCPRLDSDRNELRAPGNRLIILALSNNECKFLLASLYSINGYVAKRLGCDIQSPEAPKVICCLLKKAYITIVHASTVFKSL